MVLASATSAPDQHLYLMDGLFPHSDSSMLAERRRHLQHLARIGLPDRFKTPSNVNVPAVFVVERESNETDENSSDDSEAEVSE